MDCCFPNSLLTWFHMFVCEYKQVGVKTVNVFTTKKQFFHFLGLGLLLDCAIKAWSSGYDLTVDLCQHSSCILLIMSCNS